MPEIKKLTEPLNFDKWTCRASSSGKLNTEPKLKSEKEVGALSQTAKSFLHEIYWSERYGTTKEIHGVFLESGKLRESAGISLISEVDDPDLFEMGTEIYEKCKEPRVFSDYFQGECDIHSNGKIQDIKCCWDIYTFRKHIDELVLGNGENTIENDDYDCQGVVYTEIYGEEEFWLRYCLVNMPDEIIAQELNKIKWNYGGKEDSPYYQDAMMEFLRNCKFDTIPPTSRVATFKVKRNPEKYQFLVKQVIKSRLYLNWYAEQMFYFENPGLKPVTLKNKTFDWKSVNIVINEEVVEGVKSIDLIAEPSNQTKVELNSDQVQVELNSNQTNEEQISEEIEPDEFTLRILALSNVDEAVSFYMENSDLIDDTKYEQIFQNKKEELSNPVESPKIKKQTVKRNREESNATTIVAKEEVNEFTGNERYSISDGVKNILNDLPFEKAKSEILIYSEFKFIEWKTVQEFRDGITTFYNSNKNLIDRFKQEFEYFAKAACEILIAKERKEIEEMVNRM